LPEKYLGKDLKINLEIIKREFNIPLNNDIITKELKIGRKTNAFIAYIDGMVDKQIINNFILRQLMNPARLDNHLEEGTETSFIDYITENILSVHENAKMRDIENIVFGILNGDTAIFIDGCDESIIVDTRGFEKRCVDKPLTENVIKGSHEGFTENLRTNITLIRKKVKNKNLMTEMIPVGKLNKAYCAVMYIEGMTNPSLIAEVKKRLNKVAGSDFILGEGMLSKLLEDSPIIPVPQVLSTERPDRAASFVMKGQVLILLDGSPYAAAVPVTFFHLFHSAEEYELKSYFGTFMRFIRITGVLFALFLPGLYIVLVTHEQEMLPTELLMSIAQTREFIPFPVVIELLLMELSFELLREAGIRVPGIIGQTLTIVGALILGQAAVAANIVSPILVIVVAITAIATYTIPNYSLSWSVRLAKFVFIFLATIAGFYGISAGIFLLGGLLCSIKSFGVPFLSPVAPKTKSNKDVVIMYPDGGKHTGKPDFLNPIKNK